MSSSHRQWEPPRRPWSLFMRWHDLLFAHWAVEARTLRNFVPRELEIDTFESKAWVAVTPFRMSGIRHRLLPPIPALSAFPELNVRTYVRFGDRPGVWFFSLDAASAIAVRVARWRYHLPYFRARMSCDLDDDTVRYHSRRTHRAAPEAHFEATYRAIGDVFAAPRGSLESFLTDRYCLYAKDKHGTLWRGEIDHPPWPLQPAQAEITVNTMARVAGIELPAARPLLHFAKQLDVVAWMLERA